MNESDGTPTGQEQPKLILQQVEDELQALSNKLQNCIGQTRIIMGRNGLKEKEELNRSEIKEPSDLNVPERVNRVGVILGDQIRILEANLTTIAKAF